jgi:hypothetical protein
VSPGNLGVVEQVPVGLAVAAEVIEGTAESEVGHRVAGLQAHEPLDDGLVPER